MKFRNVQRFAALVACTGMALSPAVRATATERPWQPADVALRQGGVLVGQFVDAHGAPVADTQVALYTDGKEVVRVSTDAQGNFAVPGLKGGVYQMAAPGHQGVYRLWAPQTAPPTARPGVLAVARGDLTRGQGPATSGGCFASAMGWISQHPFITAGIVATAVAVPLALDDDDAPAS